MTWQPTSVSNKTGQTKLSTLTSHHLHALLSTSHIPYLSEWHHWPQAPKLAVNPGSVPPTSSHRTFLEFIPFCSDLHHFFPKPLYPKLPKWLLFPFSPAPNPLQQCCQSHLYKTKSDYVTSLFRTFVFRIKCKILPRTYKALYYLASDYLPCFIWGCAPRSKQSKLEVPKQCFSVCPECNSLICPSGKLPLIFFRLAQNSGFIMLSSGLPSHFAPLPILTLIQPDTIICLFLCLSLKTRNRPALHVFFISVFCLLNEGMSQDLNKNIQTAPDKYPSCESKWAYRLNPSLTNIFNLTILVHQK